jgi:hypothetical protein
MKNKSKDIAFPITLFVASGGIGFLLGVVYHTLYWREWTIKILPRADHTQLIERAIDRKWLEIYEHKNKDFIPTNAITRSDAFCIVTAFWHEHLKEFNKIESANPRVVSLTDIMHGLGATYFGSIFALIVLIIYIILSGDIFRWYWIFPGVIALFFALFHLHNFDNTVKQVQEIVDMVFIDVLREYNLKYREPAKKYLGLSDRKR